MKRPLITLLLVITMATNIHAGTIGTGNDKTQPPPATPSQQTERQPAEKIDDAPEESEGSEDEDTTSLLSALLDLWAYVY